MKKQLLASALVFGLLLTGCTIDESTSTTEQKLTEQNQARLLDSQPPVKLNWSLERENINKRTTLWNDANKVSYIYLINYGKVMAFYTIKGKVSSVNSQITNTEYLASKYNNGHYVDGVLPSPSEDGSYGTNGNAIFFFDTQGTYYEWAGDYLLVDQPMKLTSPVELVRQVK